MISFSLATASAAMHGALQGEIGGWVTGVAFDTRKAQRGDLFFALRTEHNDGHKYLDSAIAKGCCAAVVDHHIESLLPQIVVPNTLTALGDLASYYRDLFHIPIIGITGSVGKTTVKDMTTLALSSLHPHATQANLNNEIGVPMTLFQMEREHGAAIIEMGMRGLGEIAALAEVARPTVAVITNIGVSHLEVVGSRDAIAAAKAELLETMPPDGVAVIPADDDYFAFLADTCRPRCRFVSFGTADNADYRVTNTNTNVDGMSFRINGELVLLSAIGGHLPVNAAAAFATASELGIPPDEISKLLSGFQSPPMRLKRIRVGQDITLIDDTYNAAPDSMISALQTLRTVAGQHRTVAILGEMRELGSLESEGYFRVEQAIQDAKPDLLITVGNARCMKSAAGTTRIELDTPEDAIGLVPSSLREGDVVLVKASRAIALERVVSAIQMRFQSSDLEHVATDPQNVAESHI